MLLIGHQTYAGDESFQLSFKAPTAQQRNIVIDVLGEDFVKGEDGPFEPELVVSQVDLGDAKQTLLVVVQKSLCSNKTCEFHFFSNDSGKWKEIAAISSWDIPYFIQSKSKACNFIIITDDCDNCSTAKPVRYVCELQSDSIVTGIAQMGLLSEEESKKYKEITWAW